MQGKAIKNKIKSTASIKKITRTMEMVSVAKMKKATSLAESFKSFGIESKKLISIIADQREKHELSLSNKNKKDIIIILVAGQKGLCGGYNSNLYRYIYKKYKLESDNIKFITIGKYAEKIAKKFITDKNKENIISSFSGKEFTHNDTRVIIKEIISSYKENKTGSVNLIYTDFINVTSQFVNEIKLLPFSNEILNVTEKNNKIDELEYTFEPSVEKVYSFIVNIILQNMLSGNVLRARAAEHAARMAAMKTATDNAGEMLKDLKKWYNKARQASITQEIAEISSGAMANSDDK